MRRHKNDIVKFQAIIGKYGSPLNKGLNAYSANPRVIDSLIDAISIYPEYKENAKELAMMVFDGQRNGSNSDTALYNAIMTAYKLLPKNLKIKLDKVPYIKGAYKRVFKLRKLTLDEALVVLKSRLSVTKSSTISRYKAAMEEIDLARENPSAT